MKYTNEYLNGLVKELSALPRETEWVEFKHNNGEPERVGQYISALANSAALAGKTHGYLVWGIEDETHGIVGTTFKPSAKKVKNQELESWLLQLLEPKIDFAFHSLAIGQSSIILLEVTAAYKLPVRFQGVEYVRVGTCMKKLKDLPEKERALWRIFDREPFELQLAVQHLGADEVLRHLDYPSYFELMQIPLPTSKDGILEALEGEDIIIRQAEQYGITNLGALLFAKDLTKIRHLKRKTVRVIQYKGQGKIETIREYECKKGYATGFEDIIEHTLSWLPTNEVLGQALRKNLPMFPSIAIREIVANALIHQELEQRGTQVMVELFVDRLEITNPGLPLVKTERFLDSPPKSRNEYMASLLRRIGICEERGSGVDKIVESAELFQLPAPLFEVTDEHTRAVLFAHRELKDMDKDDKRRACYLHACLRYVQRDFMTNTSLRERFGIKKENSAIVSRLIREAVENGLIQPYDPEAGKKYMKYIPFWAGSS